MQSDNSKQNGVHAAFGNMVREGRIESEWTQKDLANELRRAGVDLDPTAITRIERGTRSVKLDEAAALSSVLNIKLDQFVRQFEDPDYFLGLAREEARRSMCEANDALKNLAFSLVEVWSMLKENPERLAALGEGAPSDADAYYSWVLTRMQTMRWSKPHPVGTEQQVEELEAILHELTTHALCTVEQWEALTKMDGPE